MKEVKSILSIFVLSMLMNPLGSKDIKINEARGKVGDPIRQSGRVYDDRFLVKNMTFRKYYDTNGLGDNLEANFDIENLTDDTIGLTAFFIAFYERNYTDRPNHGGKSYPRWGYFEEKAPRITYADSIPFIEKNSVFDTNEGSRSDKKQFKRYEYPSFMQYNNYMSSHMEQGVKLNLYGLDDEIKERSKAYCISKDKKSIVACDAKNRPAAGPSKPNVYTEMLRLKTTVYLRLFSRYRAKQEFFNHFGIVLYDENEKKVVYRQFLRFKTPFRVR